MRMVGRRYRRWLGGAALGLLIVSALAVTIPSAADALPTTVSVSASASAGMAQVVPFTGNGFVANETIAFWLTAPDHSVVPLNQAQADNLGAFSVAVSLTSDGIWQATAHGMMSKHEVINRFIVGTAGTPGATSQALATDTPAPTSQPVAGQAVTFSAYSFGVGETISLWATAPDGKVHALPVQQADSNGILTAHVTFDTGGYWQVTAHGQATGHESIQGFTVANAPATATPVPTAPPTDAPATPTAPTGTITNQPLPIGQQLVTPSAMDLTPPAAALQPPDATPTNAP